MFEKVKYALLNAKYAQDNLYQSTNFRITRRGTKKSHLFANLVSSERTATVCYKATRRFTHRNSHSHAIVVIKRFATRIRWYCMKEFTQGGSHTSVTPAIIHFPNQHIFSLIRDLCTLLSLKNVKFVKRSSNRVNMPDFQCEKCMKMFKLSSHLKAHKAVHEKKISLLATCV